MKKLLVNSLTIMMILGSLTISYGADYKDVKNTNWAYGAVNAISEKGVIKGYPDGSFKPNNTVSYGEFIKMALIAATGQDVGNAQKGYWANSYYNKALELGYFTAYDINKSQLTYEITRGDMALIISSILGDIKIEDYDNIQKGIKDIDYQTKHEYDITKAYYKGILTGYTDNTFKPEKTLSRAESATVIYRLVDESKREVPGGKKEEEGTKVTYKTSGLLDMEKLTPDKTIANSVRFTEDYELYTDASEWDMKIYKEWDGSLGAFDHTLRGHIYLIKDGGILEYCNTGPRYDSEGNYLKYQRSAVHYDISQADYIIAVPSNASYEENSTIIKVVVNPFKK